MTQAALNMNGFIIQQVSLNHQKINNSPDNHASYRIRCRKAWAKLWKGCATNYYEQLNQIN